MTTEPMAALETGIDMGSNPDPMKAQAQAIEKAAVKDWQGKVSRARKFDEAARVQFAKDRRYARGDSGFEVDANLVGTNIDILEAFLYAKDPDFDVTQGSAVKPPTLEAIKDAAEDEIRGTPEVVKAGQQGMQLALMQGMDQMGAILQAEQIMEQVTQEKIAKQVEEARKRFARRSRDIKAFAETCEIIGSSMWTDASLKRRGRPWVRSGLTIGMGVLKASWQERTAQSPETAQAINDLQHNIARARSLEAQLEDENPGIIERIKTGVANLVGSGEEAKIAALESQLQTLQNQAERVVARGYVVDNVAGEDFTVAPGYTIANHLDAPWNDHRIFVSYQDALAAYGPHLAMYAPESVEGYPEKVLKGGVKYSARKPETVRSESAMLDQQTTEKDADAYIEYNLAPDTVSDDGEEFYLALHETWDRDSNTVKTWIEGVKCWVKPEWTPPATTRFYPFFLFCMSEVDGQRFPQSPVTRTMKLVDEYNRIGSAEAEHRRRVLPKTMFHLGAIAPASIKKLEGAITQEMVGVETTVPTMGLQDLLVPVPYAMLDPALYDRQRIIGEIERVWSIQEALGGAVNVQKTATEADIQQSGFNARTGGRRDLVESALSELAEYTIEVARKYITPEDAIAIAGPDAFWPAYGGPDDLSRMVDIQVRAGTSGKPDTNADRQAWSTMLPLLQSGIMQIGQLRMASPNAIADSLEQLLRITAEKSGDRIDIDQLIPQADGSAMPMGMPGAPMGAPAPGGAPSPDGMPAEAGAPFDNQAAAEPAAAAPL